MITDFGFIDAIRALINVPSISSLVDFIRPFESLPSDYTNKKKFIVIGFQSGSAEDVQQATININIYVPDMADGSANISILRTITNALMPILWDAYNSNSEIEIQINGTPKTYKEQDVTGYHFTNIKVLAETPNIFQPTN